MRLLRFIPNLKDFRKVYIERDKGVVAPVSVLMGLMPSEKERNHISLFEMEEGGDPLSTLAAFSMIAKGQFAVVHVDKDEVLKLDVKLKKTKAATDNDEVNDRHVDAYFDSGRQAFLVAELFYNGVFVAYEDADVRERMVKDHISGSLDLIGAAKRADAQRPAKICEIISRKCALLLPPEGAMA